MANKQTVQQDYIVNIKARAEQMTKELNNLRSILNNLKLDSNFAKSAEARIKESIKIIEVEMDKLGDGFMSDRQVNAATQRMRKVRGEINRLGKDFEAEGYKAENVFMSDKEYEDALAKVKALKKKLSALRSQTKKVSGKGGAFYQKNQRDSLRAAVAEGGSAGLTEEKTKIEKEIRSKITAEQRKSVVSMAGSKEKAEDSDALTKIREKKQAEINELEKKGSTSKRLEVLKAQRDVLNEQLKILHSIKALEEDVKNVSPYAGRIDAKKGGIAAAETVAVGKREALISNAQIELNKIQPQLEDLGEGAQDVEKGMIGAGNAMQTAEEKAKGLSELGNYFKHMLGPTMLLMRAIQTVKQVFQDFMEIDKQLNEISIVTGKSMENLWGNFERLNSLAQEYGVKTTDVIAVQKLYYQQGRSAAEVTQLQGETLKFAKISGLDFADATDKMTAAINAYKISAADASKVTDVYAALSAKAAVDAEEVAVAMSKVASIAALSGSEFEDTSAYLSKIIETTREAPETAGTALKTVIARFTEVKNLTEDQKELLDEDYNFNNIEKALKTVGVAVKDSVGNMRGFTDILNDLGPMWDNLSSNQQHYIATMAAGSRQQSRFIALMDDWGRTEELTSVATQSAGTGNKQLALSLESIETSTNRLAASWQEFYTNFLSSDLFKTIIDGANKFLSILNEISDIGGVFGPALIVAVLAITKTLIASAFHMGQGFWKSFKAGYESAKGVSEAADLAKDTAKATKKAGFLGKLWGKIKGQTQAATEDIEEEKKHQKDMGDAVRHGTLEGATEGKAHGRAEALGQKAGKIGKGFGKFKQGFKHPFKTLGAGKAESGKKVLTLSRGTSMGGKVVGGKIATSAGAAGAAGAGTGAGAGAGAAGVLGTVGAVASVAAAVIAAFAIGTAIFHAAVAAEEKEILENTQKAQEDIDKRKQDVADMSSSYNEALELEQKGLLKTGEETERYQEILTGLKETYAQLVKVMADGTLALNNQTEAYDNLMDSQIEAIKKQNEVYNAISENKNVAIAAGVVTTEEGRKLQESIKNTAASLSAMTSDNIELLTGVNIDPEEFQEMAEKGLNRQTLNEALHTDFGNFMFQGYDTSDGYANFLNGIIDNHSETMATEEAKVFEYLAAQSGKTAAEMAQVLKDQTSNKSIASAQLDNLGAAIASKYGDVYSTALTAAFTKAGATKEENVKEEDWEYDTKKSEDIMEKYYSVLTQKDRDEFEKFVDSISTTMDKNSLDTLVGSLEETDVKTILKMFGLSDDMKDVVVNAIEEATKARDEALRGANGDAGYLGQILEARGIEKTEANMDALEKELAAYDLNQIQAMGASVAQIGAKYGSAAGDQAYEARKAFLDKIKGNGTLTEGLGQVDLFDAESIAKYKAQLISLFSESSDEVSLFTDLVEKSSDTIDRNFKNVSDVVSSAKNDIEDLKEGMEKLADAVDGTLSLEDMFDLISEFPKAVSFDDFTATSEGYTLTQEKLLEIEEKMINAKKISLALQAEQYARSIDQLELNIQSMKGLENFSAEEYARLQNAAATGEITSGDIRKYEELNKVLEDNGAQLDANNIVIQKESREAILKIIELIDEVDYKTDEVTKRIKKRIDALKNYIENLNKIEVFIDLDSFDRQLNLDIAHYDFVIEFSTNADEIANATEKKIAATAQKINNNIARSQGNAALAKATRADLEQNYSKYVKFDEAGNIMLQEEAIAGWAERIKNLQEDGTEASSAQAEKEQEAYNLFVERTNAYRDYNEQSKEAANNAEKEAQAIQDIITAQREAIVDAEDMWRDLLVKRDEEALESLEKRYDAMKEMDEEYLDSVREAVEEERRIRDNANEYEDIAQMERKLNILRMSGGSAVEIQKLEQELADRRQDWNDSQVDQILDDMEKSNEMRAAALDEEVTYEKAVLDEKKRNQIAYNEEIKDIMSKTKKEQLAIWKKLDKEYEASSDQNKILLEQKTQAVIDKSIAADKVISGQVVPTIDGKVKELAGSISSDPDSAQNAVKNFANEVTTDLNASGQACKSIQEVTNKFINLKNEINYTAAAYRELAGAYGEYNKTITGKNDDPKKSKVSKFDKEEVTIGGKTYASIGGKWYGQDQFSEVSWAENSGTLKEGAKGSKTITLYDGSIHTDASGTKYYKDGKGNTYTGVTSTRINGQEAFKVDLNKFKTYTPSNLIKAGTYMPSAYNGIDENFYMDDGTKVIGTPSWGGTENIRYGQKGNIYINTLGFRGKAIKVQTKTIDGNKGYIIDGYFYKQSDLEKKTAYYYNNKTGQYDITKTIYRRKKDGTPYYKYATGGIVDYTGPAWVDGTPSKPEAFLSAKDTALIASLTDVLSFRTKGFSSVTPVQNSGDTYYQIHINVDELGDGYSVDDLIDEMEERILAVTGKTGVIKVN